jgi:hypothetical protein
MDAVLLPVSHIHGKGLRRYILAVSHWAECFFCFVFVICDNSYHYGNASREDIPHSAFGAVMFMQ